MTTKNRVTEIRTARSLLLLSIEFFCEDREDHLKETSSYGKSELVDREIREVQITGRLSYRKAELQEG